jgi:hypothetical protein
VSSGEFSIGLPGGARAGDPVMLNALFGKRMGSEDAEPKRDTQTKGDDCPEKYTLFRAGTMGDVMDVMGQCVRVKNEMSERTR